MRKVLTVFFVTLGVIFFIIILAGVYFYIADPFGLKQLLLESSSDTHATSTAIETDKHPLLTPAQEEALETFGIDPASVPSSISPEQEACFVEVFGEARVAEIKAGDSPTAIEFFKAKSCL